MFFSDRAERRFNFSVWVETYFVDEATESVPVEPSFDLAEHSFDGVELRGVSHVEDSRNIQFIVPRFDIFGLMHVELIHEYC